MKLLIYSHFFAPSIGGVETIVLSLARGLAEFRNEAGVAEFDVTLATKIPAGGYDDSSLPFRVVRKPGFLRLWQLIRNSDIVHVAGPAIVPLLLSILSGKPVVMEHHGFQTICPNGQLLIEPDGMPCPGHFMAGRHGECLRCNAHHQGWLGSYKLWALTFLRRFLCASAVANVTPTQWLGTQLHLPHIVTIPHGLDVPKAVAPRGQIPGKPVIAFVGRLVNTKGAGVLLQAAKILRERKCSVEFLIIGDGPERPFLEQLASDFDLGGHARFVGRLGDEQLDASLARALAVVVPSLGGEVFGLAVAENMARGLAVVTSDLGALTEVLGGTGLVFKTGDATDLAAALARLLKDRSLADALGRRARQRAIDFCSKSRMIDAHAHVYEGARARSKG
jgi:glycosyltransferase involved in cell wall biosynthesis